MEVNMMGGYKHFKFIDFFFLLQREMPFKNFDDQEEGKRNTFWWDNFFPFLFPFIFISKSRVLL